MSAAPDAAAGQLRLLVLEVDGPAAGAGYVYFVRNPDTNRIKVGYSADPRKRLVELQVGSGSRLELIASFPGGRALEAELHSRLRPHRVVGEWFEECSEVRAAIATLQLERLLGDPEAAALLACAQEWSVRVLEQHDPRGELALVRELRDLAYASADRAMADELIARRGSPTLADVVEYHVGLAELGRGS